MPIVAQAAILPLEYVAVNLLLRQLLPRLPRHRLAPQLQVRQVPLWRIVCWSKMYLLA